MYLIIDDDPGSAAVWKRIANDAGMACVRKVIGRNASAIAIKLKPILKKKSFKIRGTILDWTLKDGDTAEDLWNLLTKKEKSRCGRVVVVTKIGDTGSGLADFAKRAANDRLIETLVFNERLAKLQQVFVKELDLKERVFRLEEALAKQKKMGATK